MSRTIVDVMRALHFAARKHRDQRRKGAAAEPYINHLAEVAHLVAEATEGKDTLVVIGALLHDAIEDTQTTREELEREFGPEVAALVAELSDEKRLPSAERKRLQIKEARFKTRRARLIKIADKTSNLCSMLESPPVSWDARRQRDYLEFAHEVVASCRSVSSMLEAQFDAAYQAGLSRLKGRMP